MIFANLKNGCKRACNLVKNSRAVRFCVLVAVCLTFNVATALAQSGGGAGYEAGKNAISQASEQIAQYVPIATKLCYAIAGVVAIVGAISVYAMTNFKVDGEDILIGDFNCEQSLILQYYMLISKYCIDLMTNSIIETLYLLIITFLSDMPGMKCKQYKK